MRLMSVFCKCSRPLLLFLSANVFIGVLCRLCSSAKSPSNHLKDSLERMGHVKIMAKYISTMLQRKVI